MLERRGLGRVVDFETLERETAEFGYCAAEEVVVELAHRGYGRELVDGIIIAAGISPGSPIMPSGCDGIHFGYRDGQSGLWACYPIDGEFKFMADNVTELVEGWSSGNLSV
jgi:hypothetical protein